MKLIEPVRYLISGVPACGKTTFGEWLKRTRSFKHVEWDDWEPRAQMIIDWKAGNIAAGDALLKSEFEGQQRFVFTWGHDASNMSLDAITRFASSHGFRTWWFDGPKKLAREQWLLREFRKRGEPTGDEREKQVRRIDLQMEKLTKAEVTLQNFYGRNMLRTLDESSSRLPPGQIAKVLGVE